MRISKVPLEKSTYFWSLDTTQTEFAEFTHWLNTHGKHQYKMVSYNSIIITDPAVEVMFILKWIK